MDIDDDLEERLREKTRNAIVLFGHRGISREWAARIVMDEAERQLSSNL